MPIIEDLEQRSPEWLQMRLAMCTASRVGDVLAKPVRKDGELQCRKDYKSEIVCEALTGRLVEHFVSVPMQWGIDNEPLARAAYEIELETEVEQVGFAIHDVISRFGASPDGLVGKDGMVQFKCPNTATHLEYIIAGVVPAEYQPQMLAEMACTGRKWSDFASFDPRLPKKLQLFVRRFERDDARIAEMEAEVVRFLAEVDELIERVKSCTLVDLDPTLTTRLLASIAAANSRGGKSL